MLGDAGPEVLGHRDQDRWATVAVVSAIDGSTTDGAVAVSEVSGHWSSSLAVEPYGHRLLGLSSPPVPGSPDPSALPRAALCTLTTHGLPAVSEKASPDMHGALATGRARALAQHEGWSLLGLY